MRALRVICAWCDECLSGPASAPATHTICRACVVKYFPAQALAIGALQDGSTFVAHDTATVPPRRARFVAAFVPAPKNLEGRGTTQPGAAA